MPFIPCTPATPYEEFIQRTIQTSDRCHVVAFTLEYFLCSTQDFSCALEMLKDCHEFAINLKLIERSHLNFPELQVWEISGNPKKGG